MTTSRRVGWLVATLLFAGVCVPGVQGQWRPTISGQVGSYGELYGVSGREARRPSSTGRLFLRPTVGLTEHLTVAFDFRLSTEGSFAGGDATSGTLARARQRLNQLGVSPGWGWGRADLGDFTDFYSPLTFSGVRVRGAGLTVTPGRLRVSGFGGSARQSVVGGATNGSYSRTVAGGRVGLGDPDGTHLDLIVVRSSDDPASLPSAGDTAFIDPRTLEDPTLDPDTLPVGTLVNPLSVTPQENLVAAAGGQVEVGPVTWSTEIAASAYTRDVRASEIDNAEVLAEFPPLARKLFTPRVGSNVSVAHTNELDVRVGIVDLTASHRHIPAGYVSLGVASLLNDRRVTRLRGSARFGRRVTVRWDGSRQSDNLAGQKSFTTLRHTLGGILDTRITPGWRSTLRANYIAMGNDLASGDERRIAYGNIILATNQVLSLGRDGLARSVGLRYTFRHSGDDNPARRSSSLASHGVDVRTLLAPVDRLTVTPSLGIVETWRGGRGWSTRATYSVSGRLRAQDGRLTTSLSLGRTEDRGIDVSQARVSSRYQLTSYDDLTLMLRASTYAGAPAPGGGTRDFEEFTMTLRWSHRFSSDEVDRR